MCFWARDVVFGGGEKGVLGRMVEGAGGLLRREGGARRSAASTQGLVWSYVDGVLRKRRATRCRDVRPRVCRTMIRGKATGNTAPSGGVHPCPLDRTSTVHFATGAEKRPQVPSIGERNGWSLSFCPLVLGFFPRSQIQM